MSKRGSLSEKKPFARAALMALLSLELSALMSDYCQMGVKLKPTPHLAPASTY